MGNKITDLNNHLFAQLDRLANDTMTEEQLEREVKRADAIVAVSEQIVKGATVTLQATKLVAEYGVHSKIGSAMAPLIEGETKSPTK